MIIWLASYPKSGNTWLRSILSSLLYSQDGDFDFEQIDEFEGLEQDDWLMDINGVREEFDPETQKLLAQF